MNFKKFLEKRKNDYEKNQVYYRVSKFIFIFMTLIFFLSLYFTASRFYEKIFLYLLPYSYILYLLSFLFYTFYFIKVKILSREFFKKFNSKFFDIIIFVILFILFILFSSIVILWKDILNYL